LFLFTAKPGKISSAPEIGKPFAEGPLMLLRQMVVDKAGQPAGRLPRLESGRIATSVFP